MFAFLAVFIIMLGLTLGMLGITSVAVVVAALVVNAIYLAWMCWDLYWRK